MGLAITAYRGLSLVERTRDADHEMELLERDEGQGHDEALVLVKANALYNHEWMCGTVPGLYRYAASVQRSFGPCSAFNDFREQLGDMAGYEFNDRYSDEGWISRCPIEGVFRDLILFSDCEGFMGTTSAKRLFADCEAIMPAVDHAFDKGVFGGLFVQQLENIHLLASVASRDGGMIYS